MHSLYRLNSLLLEYINKVKSVFSQPIINQYKLSNTIVRTNKIVNKGANIPMSFKDELNKNTKTPQDEDEYLRSTMDTNAHLEYLKIKEYMLHQVKHGEYTNYGNKKRVVIYHELYFDLSKFVKEENINIKQSVGFFKSKTITHTKRRIVFDESKRKEYNYFISSITKYGKEDGMEIVPVMYNRTKNDEYSIPTPIIDGYFTHYKFCLKCTMTY